MVCSGSLGDDFDGKRRVSKRMPRENTPPHDGYHRIACMNCGRVVIVGSLSPSAPLPSVWCMDCVSIPTRGGSK